MLPLVIPAGKNVVPSPIQVAGFADFTGGLDWSRGGNLDPKATDDMLNVEVFDSGGFGSRRGIKWWTQNTFNYFNARPAHSIGKCEDGNGNSVLVICDDGGRLFYSLGGTPWTSLVEIGMNPAKDVWQGIEVAYRFYFQDGLTNAYFFAWVGGEPQVGILMDPAVNGTWNQLTGPDGTRTPRTQQGSMPIGCYMAFYHDRIFVLCTREQGKVFPNRIRWSYPIINGLGGEDFRADTWVDIDDGVDGDEIVGAMGHGASLFVFKHNSIHHIEGFDETDLSFLPLNLSAGVVGPAAFANSEEGIYFWDQTRGLCMIERAPIGSDQLYNVVPLSTQLETKLRDGTIRQEDIALVEVAMAAGERHVHCSVPWYDGTQHMLVYDKVMKCWMHWDLDLKPLFLNRPTKGRAALLAGSRGFDHPWRIVQVNGTEDAIDYYGQNMADWVPFRNYYRTANLGLDAPFTAKMVLVLEAIANGQKCIWVEVSRDWDPDNYTGDADLILGGNSPVGPQDPPLLALYNSIPYVPWGSLAAPNMEALGDGSPPQIDRCNQPEGWALEGPLTPGHRVTAQIPKCHYRGIQLRFSGHESGAAWQILAFSLKYFAQTRVM